MPRLALPSLALLALTSLPLHAHDHVHQHNAAAHQHGIGHLDLVVEGEQLLLELNLPAADLLGFEHAPRTAEQHQQVDALREQLQQARELFGLPAAAQCSLDSVQLDSSLFAEAAHSGDDAHSEHAHADISARYQFSCAAPQQLRQLEVLLFEQFPGSETLLLQAITPAGQQGGELNADNHRVRL